MTYLNYMRGKKSNKNKYAKTLKFKKGVQNPAQIKIGDMSHTVKQK